ncbi:MAG: iron-containing alcohol dehydrogenase [Acidimicrobiales bacterium]
MDPSLGIPFDTVEADALDAIAGLDAPVVLAVNDPPWNALESRVSTAVEVLAVVPAWDMELGHLQRTADGLATSVDPDRLARSIVVGVGGGTALDTAKFLASTLGRPLVQVPTITSVDAGFTDAIGVRDGGRVRYVGKVVPLHVVIDLPLVRSAPPSLNRAGIGDVLSCHTGLFDWRLATARGEGHPWDETLAGLGRSLLDELEAAVDDIAAVSDAGVRFLVDAYRRVGAACAAVGHSRFEEGSEHFWAYAYEHATRAHPVHGEIISFAVCAMAHVQGNDPERAAHLVRRSGVRAHPDDLGISFDDFSAALGGLAAYARAEGLDVSVVDLHPVDERAIAAAWRFASSLPRVG